MTQLDKKRCWFRKETKKEGVIISVLNFYWSIFPLWFNILNNLLIMDSLTGTIKYFVSCFFTMFRFHTPWNYQNNLWFSDIFREYKTGLLRRNRLSFLAHFSPAFLFYIPCKRQKTLRFLAFPEGIKSEHWEEIGEIISYFC